MAIAVKPVHFTWKTDVNADMYAYDGPKGSFKAGGKVYFRPMVGNIEFPPNTGKYYYEMLCNGDNFKIGVVASAGADVSGEMGHAAGTTSCYLQNGVCDKGGQELKKCWRLLVPVAGCYLGCVWDSDTGTLQMFQNLEFVGTVVTEAFGLKGVAVRPAVGIAGLEDHNRNIGTGMKSAIVQTAPRLPRGLTLAP